MSTIPETCAHGRALGQPCEDWLLDRSGDCPRCGARDGEPCCHYHLRAPARGRSYAARIVRYPQHPLLWRHAERHRTERRIYR